MDRLRERVEEELDAAAAAGRQLSEIELSERLAPEFCGTCGQADVRSCVVSTMQERLKYRNRAFPPAVRKDRWRWA